MFNQLGENLLLLGDFHQSWGKSKGKTSTAIKRALERDLPPRHFKSCVMLIFGSKALDQNTLLSSEWFAWKGNFSAPSIKWSSACFFDCGGEGGGVTVLWDRWSYVCPADSRISELGYGKQSSCASVEPV